MLKLISHDWNSDKVRFIVESTAWCASVGCSVTMAVTVPNPPLMWLYPLWVGSSAMYAWAAWTRKSCGMLMNYAVLTAIDVVGLVRTYM